VSENLIRNIVRKEPVRESLLRKIREFISGEDAEKFDFSRFDYFFDYPSFKMRSPAKESFKEKFRALHGVSVASGGFCKAYGLMIKTSPAWCSKTEREKPALKGVFTFPNLCGLAQETIEAIKRLPAGFLVRGRSYYAKGRFFIDVTKDVMNP
jgi:hypothetical protein